jgi:peroxiredoxin
VALAGFSMGGEMARYIGRYGTERVLKAMLLGAVPPFLLKTGDNPEGADKSVFDGMLATARGAPHSLAATHAQQLNALMLDLLGS